MHRHLLLLTVASLAVGACSPLGIATGTGAALGVASAQEGGIKGAAQDLRIKAAISDAWFQYDLNTFAKLTATVDQGRVLLTGVVQDPEARVEAVRRVWQVEGVKQVINEIKVADGEGVPGYLNDKWISTRLRTEMTFDADIQSINYTIETVQGVVYLMGVARSQEELDRVTQRARTIPNVKQVVSYVKMAGETVDSPSPGSASSSSSSAGDLPPAAPPVDAAAAPVQVTPSSSGSASSGSSGAIESEILPPP